MDISAIFHDGWKDYVRIGLAAPVIYLTIIAFIRLAGKRSTSQMNNFDWVVMVALGAYLSARDDNINMDDTAPAQGEDA